ncbi:immunity 49 family protein [Streptomyces sp. NBC_01304]|uniref:immunity 49 family protein n=1 Tax=Streptomyces sp. NBC_01304 TaxID=2903818 RepID=UPI002E1589FD|nr:immunity 49 family protein [Streptomyces sp. NBC_01304]
MIHDDTPATPGAPDPDLPMLTAVQAARLRALAAPHLGEGGASLHNLALLCRQEPEDRWPAFVEDHFTRLRQASRGGESAEELLRGTHARLLPTDAISGQLADHLRYARQIADGLVFAYALDGPTSVRILTDADVARTEIEELGAAAYRNLMSVPVKHDEVPVEGRALLHSLYGDSPFVASKALFLSEAARQVTGEPLPDAGALVVVPTRHLLAYHPIVDGSVVDAVNDLAAYGFGAYQDGPGELSPRVYWWHKGALTSLTVIDDDTRSFSVQPPPDLLALMKGLVGLDRAGRLASRTVAEAPDVAQLARTTGDFIARIAEDPAALAEAFASAVTLAHAHCATDPKADRVETWDAWATAVQLGSALFSGAQPQTCYLGEDIEAQLPLVPAAPPADARAWLDAFYLAVVCRQQGRADRLCEVPLDVLRQDDSVDAYVFHWIDALQTFWLRRRPLDDVVEKLVATIEASEPAGLTHAPKDFVNLIDYQPVALFHRLITRDHDAFNEALATALDHYGDYWGDSAAPRGRVALGLLAMTSLAYAWDFPVNPNWPCLPTYLVDGSRIETMPG